MVVLKVEPVSSNYLTLIVVLTGQLFVVLDGDIYSRRAYLLLMEAHSYMSAKISVENDNVVMEMQATEMRFLIGNVAHDLKTPLQAFSYELEILKNHPSVNESTSSKESLLLLESVCSFMLMTINRAIDYTKVTSGIKLKPSMSTVDMKAVFDWVKMCVSHTVTANSVEIVMDPISDEICNFIITDQQWLMENLLCLISNAQKFTAKGEIRIKYTFCDDEVARTEIDDDDDDDEGSVKDSSWHDDQGMQLVSSTHSAHNAHSTHSTHSTASTTADGKRIPSMVKVEVTDDGIGIAPEIQEQLFKPFKQAMRRAGGTGLGIYSLSMRVESLGGKCGVSNRPDGKNGARFWFTIPYRPDHSLDKEEATSSAEESPTAIATSTATFNPNLASKLAEASTKTYSPTVKIPKIKPSATDASQQRIELMLVEDSPLIQKSCARSFLREGIKVDVACNGLECVEKVLGAPNQIKVLLMDVNMPLMDGLEATARIRQWEKCDESKEGETQSAKKKRLVIIGLSANSDSVSKQEGLDAGMDRFLGKPLKMSILRACLLEFNIELDDFKNIPGNT